MHSRAIVAEALRLRDEEGLGARRVAASRLGLSVGTVRDWYAGKLPRHSRPIASPVYPSPSDCESCGHDEHRFAELAAGVRLPARPLSRRRAHLGSPSRGPSTSDLPRPEVPRDRASPANAAMLGDAGQQGQSAQPLQQLRGPSRALQCRGQRLLEVMALSVPATRAGKKHARRIWLARVAAESWRSVARGVAPRIDPLRRLSLHQHRPRGLAAPALLLLEPLDRRHQHLLHGLRQRWGCHWTGAFPTDERKAVTIYVSRKDDVARMDEFIGPKA